MLKEPERIGNILSRVLQQFGLKVGIEQHKALIIWGQVVGKNISAHTKPGWINHGILWVLVDDSIWHQELEFLKPQIVEKLNQHLERSSPLEHPKIRGIKFIQKRGYRRMRKKGTRVG